MISTDFYPNYYTYNSGNIITNTTYYIPVTTEDFPNMYYLGWIRPENLPQMFKMAECTQQVTSDDVIYKWDTITPTDTNYNCGYLVKTPDGYANIQNYSILSRNAGTGIWQHGNATDNNYNWAFPNKLDVMKEGTGLTKLAILAYRFDSDDTYLGQWIGSGVGSISYSSFDFSTMIAFLYSDGSLQITSGGYTITFKKSDFDEDGTLYKNFDDSEQKCKLFICGYDFGFSRDSNGYPTCGPSFFTSFTDINGNKWVTTGNWINYNHYWAEGAGMIAIWHGGYSGTLKRSELQAMVNPIDASATGKPFAYNGTVLAIRVDYNQTYWYSCIYPPDAVAKHYALILRASTVNQDGQPLYGYTENSVYAPYVTEDNEFTATLITGNLSDDNFKAKLRPWQYDVDQWDDNDYTEDDLPPYTPPEPEPEPGDEPDEGDRGVSIPLSGNTPPMTEFLHQAAFPLSTIQSLATQLWNQPDTFWQKIVASTSENPMDYFISLRYYPLTFTHSQGNNVLNLGRGGEINLGSNYYPVDTVESFNFGTIPIRRQYNNFLDYAPYTTISIFLPYAGTFELNPTIVMGRTLKLRLDVDCTDGSGVWTVYNQTDSQPVLIKQCRIAAEVPLSGIDASQMAANIINASLQTAQHTLSFVKNEVTSKAGIVGQAIGGNFGGAAIGAVGAVLNGLGDAYNLAQASKEIPQYSGGSTGAAACSANNTPYIVYRRPLCTNPANFAHVVGYLSNKTALISSLNGFTVCRNVDVSGIGQATDKEKSQIKQILESGFYC